MRRRDLLAVAGAVAGSAGCLGRSPVARGSDTPPSFPAVTARPDPAPADVDATLDVAVVRQFAASAPARVRVAYTNTGSTEREVFFGTTVPFPPYSGERVEGDGHLSLVPDDREYVHPHPRPTATGADPSAPAGDPFVPAAPTGGCWRARAAVAGADAARRRVLVPGETVAGTYALLAHPDSTTCLAAGTYRFEDERFLGWDRPWGFVVELTR